MAVMTTVRARQARCAALGFWPGPIDGIDGKRTRAAHAAAIASQAARGFPFAHPSGITRIHWHWTGGGHWPNQTDRKSYHILILGDGTVERPVDPITPRSHTRNANGGAIGVSLCAMMGARERPLAWGTAPITPAQVSALAALTASLCLTYDIPVSRWSTLSHAEIQPTLGVAQRQKWDIAVLPGMAAVGDPISIGDRLRDMTRAHMQALAA